MKMNIICLSSATWSEVWTNKQHIMSRLAKRSHDILYVTPAISSSLLEFITKGKKHGGWGIFKKEAHLKIANSFHLPFLSIFRNLIPYNTYGFKIDLILDYIKNCQSKPIIWIYHPAYGHYLHKFPDDAIIYYDCVDDFSTFPSTQKQLDWILSGERKLLKRANLVTVTSPALKKAKSEFNNNVVYIHNVGDFHHFNQASQPSKKKKVPSLEAISGKKIGFYGAISNYKIDIKLLHVIAQKRPDLQFCLMGKVGEGEPDTNVSLLREQSNIHFLDYVAYDTLPDYLHYMDVLTIPYVINEHTSHVFPIKFFESLATGKPIVSTNLPAIEAYSDYVRIGSDPQSFLTALDTALTDTSENDREKRIRLAKKHDWDSRIDKILKSIEGVL